MAWLNSSGFSAIGKRKIYNSSEPTGIIPCHVRAIAKYDSPTGR
jgi:hypothetical protein